MHNNRQAGSVGSEDDIFDCVVTVNGGMGDLRKVIEKPVPTNISRINLAARDLKSGSIHIR